MDHLYKVIEQKIDGQSDTSSSADDEHETSSYVQYQAGQPMEPKKEPDLENRFEKYEYHRIHIMYTCLANILSIFKFLIHGFGK